MVQYLSYVPILVILLYLGFFILFRDRKNRASIYFSLFILSIFLWTLTLFLSDISKDYLLALFWSREAIIGPLFIVYFFLLFVKAFPNGKDDFSWSHKIILFIPLIFFIVLSPTSFNIASVTLRDWGSEAKVGPLYIFLLVYYLLYLFFALYILIKKYFSAKDRLIKGQIKNIFWGMTISSVLGLATNLVLLLFNYSQYSILGPIFLIFFIVFTLYAILRYKLLDLKVITAEILSILIVIVSIFQLLGYADYGLFIKVIIFIITLFIVFILIKSLHSERKIMEELKNLNIKLQKSYKDLAVANKELQRLDDAKSEFLSIASHQLRTPVTIIRGYASMIIEGSYGKVSQKIIDVMKNIALANDRLLNLIENLLDISRIEAGRLEFDLKEVNLTEVVRPIVADFQQKAKAKGLTLNFFDKDTVPLVLADTKKISEVISNVIDNSIKYTPNGEVSVSLHQEGSSVVFVCQDTGLGILSEDLPRLFHKFVRGKDMMKVHTEGTGLGMYFARTVVENMGGRIWAESPGKNKGSKFSFSLPIADKKKAKKVKSA